LESSPEKQNPRRLVQTVTAELRDIILASEPDALIGSLGDLARRLEVGVVTVQQAARVLEHEGLLEVRRGPGGGYYGRRPTEAALERSVAAYLRVHPAGFQELFQMMSLLVCEVVPLAARDSDAAFRRKLEALRHRICESRTIEEQVTVEQELHDLLFQMTDQPLMSLLGRVTSSAYKAHPARSMVLDATGIEAWRRGRLRIVDAILQGDADLAQFEANRFRRDLLERLRRLQHP
jgi:DNA-binding FadR family transcriptional regulator